MRLRLQKTPPLLLALIAVIAWGFNFVAAKVAVDGISPFLVLAMRFLFVTAILLPFYRKPPIGLSKVLIISLTFGLGHLGTMFLSLHMGLTASVGIVVDQVGVPFAILLAFLFFGEKPSIPQIIGIVLAMVGTFVLSGTPDSIDNPVAFLLMIFAGFFWALYSVQLKHYDSASALGLVAWISLFSFFITLGISIVFENNHLQMLKDSSLINWLALLYSAVFASIVAHGLWGYLMTTQDVNKVIPVILLVPVFGVLGGVLFLNETLSREMIIGSALMITGVKLSFLKYSKSDKKITSGT